MATYFHHNTAEIQQAHDGLHTLVLMNPTYVQYSTDAPPPQPPQTNLLFLNSTATTSISPSTLLHAPPPHPQPQQFVGIPLPSSTTSGSPDPNSPSIQAPHHDLSSMHGLIPRVHYNVWNTLDPSVAAREASRTQGGLSLSLSSQQPGFGSIRSEREAPHAPTHNTGAIREDVPISGGSPASASGMTNGMSGMQSVLLNSKYLKAAQELLDEVVNVGSGIKSAEAMLKRPNSNGLGKGPVDGESSASAAGKEDESGGGKRGADLTTAERQEIQMKKAKLINMIDEVEQRYRQYHHQMQIVISSFEQAAGIGSARTYSALALQTISKQFRCLKDAITGQIRSASKSLGEEDSPRGKLEGSRLKFVDHHIRQQRALQHLGMIQHNAWRPQRGLPERSVSVLRAWLFEHFLHPYPKDSDKHLLAKQTGLTRSQVSNWFINARVRLWKPMVEEMYLEEMKEQGLNGGDDKTSKSEQNEESTSKSSGPQDNAPSNKHAKNFKGNGSSNQEAPVPSPHSTSSVGGNVRNQSGFALIGSTDLEGMKQGSPKRPRNIETLRSPNSFTSMNLENNQGETNNEQVSLKFAGDRQSRDGYPIVGGPTNFIGGLVQYPIAEIGRFGTEQFAPPFPGNSVSLTLGLPHSDNLPLSGAPQNFLPSQNIQLGRRVDIGNASEFSALNASIPHTSTAYDGIDIENRKRFAAQLLPDFVA